jgi:uncharacterized protein (TIRG00374 family)
MKKRIISILQLAIGIGLLVFIFAGMKDKGELLEAFRAGFDRWPVMLGGASCFGICLLLCCVRWKWILDSRDMALPFRRVLALYFTGHFFNSFLFGSTGGDVIKAWFVAKEVHHKRTEAVTTIALDRIIGVLALILLTVTVMLIRIRFYLSYAVTRMALVFNLALLGAAVVFLVIAFGRDWLENWSWFKRLEERTVLGKIVSRSYETVRGCINHPALLAKTLVLSLANHLALVVCSYLLAVSIGAKLAFWDALTLLPVMNTVAALPIAPGGIGTRETAAKFLLGTVGVTESHAVAISLLTYGAVLGWSIIGGVVYMAYIGGNTARRDVMKAGTDEPRMDTNTHE